MHNDVIMIMIMVVVDIALIFYTYTNDNEVRACLVKPKLNCLCSVVVHPSTCACTPPPHSFEQ